MDPNNSGFIVEDELNESDFTAVSSIGGMDMKQIIDKIQKLDNLVKKNARGCTNNGDQSGMMQMGLQIGEKFGELKKENEGLKDGMAKMIKTFEELKKENAENNKEMERMKKAIEGMKASIDEKNHAFEELKEENEKLKEGLTKIKEEMGREYAGTKHEMEELKSSFNGMKDGIAEKMAEMNGQMLALKEENATFKKKTNELEKQIDELPNLTKIIDGIEWVKYNSNAFKLNAAKCGPNIAISEGGLIAKHSVGQQYGSSNILATLPIPILNWGIINKPIIGFYFEVKILNRVGDICLGFCGPQFPLDSYLGHTENSIGIYEKGGIWIDRTNIKFGITNGVAINEDVIGLGLIHKPNSQMECFATWNGHLLGKAEVPSKFAGFPIFPAINLSYANASIRANFARRLWQFKEFGYAIR